MHVLSGLLAVFVITFSQWTDAQTVPRVVDIPTRSGVTERVLLLSPPNPRATFILFPGGHGGLQLQPNGSMRWGGANFLVRTRQLFVDQGVAVAVVDAPSDRQSPPYLNSFRQSQEHVADIKALIAWARGSSKAPVWLVGTSRGTQSVAYAATMLQAPDGPDGIVLSSTILSDPKGRPVPAMSLDSISIPVVVVHHEQDECKLCPFSEVPALMSRLTHSPRAQLLSFKGGTTKGDPCEAFAYHGYNGLEQDVVRQIVSRVLAN